MLEIRLLGELEVVRGGRALTLPASKKTRALLGYLAATGKPVLRERLCELFWEGPDDPRAQLRWSLSKLRPLVDDAKRARLAADREHVTLDCADAEVDARALRATVGREPASAPLPVLRAAADRFRGELLDGLDLPGCYRFHAWLTGEREAARAQRVELLATLCNRLHDTPEAALVYARQWIAVEPLVEEAHAALVEALHRLGRGREALKAVDEAAALFERELGHKPRGALERARFNLSAQPLAPKKEPAPLADREVAPARIPLVGRQAELARLEACWQAARAGNAQRVVLVTGEQGLGKSRLLDELTARVQALGGRVLRGRAFEAEMVRPYGAWIDALRGLANNPLEGAFDGDRERLFEAVTQLLVSLAEPLLLVILDDIHWLEEASAALLHFAARAPGSGRVLFACGARPGELSDNRAALRLLRALAREGRLDTLTLEPLDAAAVAALVRAVAPAADVARVFSDSAGNPLFALEIARALAASSDPAPSLDRLFAERLDRLDTGARALLPFAAVFGRSFAPELLARASALPAADLDAGMAALERAGILRACADGEGYDFAHDLLRNAAYRSLSLPRRKLIHLHVARALAAMPGADGALAGDLAHHAALGGDLEAAARACVVAGERALKLFAFEEARELGARGLRFVSDLPLPTRLPIEMKLLSLLLHARWSRQGSEALASAISRAMLAAQEAGLTELVPLGFFLLSMVQYRTEDFAQARDSSLKQVEVARASDPKTAARTLATVSRCLFLIERDLERAAELADEAEALASQHQLALSEVPWAVGLAHYHRGDYAAASAAFERALTSGSATTDPWHQCMCLMQLAVIALEQRRPDEVARRCAGIDELAQKLGEGSEGPFGETLLQLSRVVAGDAAWPAVERALERLREVDAKSLLAYALNAAAELALERGDVAGARRRANEAIAVADKVERSSESVVAHMLLARMELDAGARKAARAHLGAVLPQLADRFTITARAREHAVAVAARLDIKLP